MCHLPVQAAGVSNNIFLLYPSLHSPSPSLQWRAGVNVLKKNSVRLAEVWMDDYSKYYYQRIGNEKGDFGDVSDRKKLR